MDLFNAGQCLEVRFTLALSINTYSERSCVNAAIGIAAVRVVTDLLVSGRLRQVRPSLTAASPRLIL